MQTLDARIIRGAALFAAVAGTLAVVVAAAVAGAKGALGATLGTALALAFFGLGQLALVRASRRWPELLLGLGFLVYVTQIGLLLGLLILLRDASFIDSRAFGSGVLAGAVGWLVGQARAGLKLKTPYVEPVPSAPTEDEPAATDTAAADTATPTSTPAATAPGGQP